MTARQVIALAATVVASAGAGWLGSQSATPIPVPEGVVKPPSTPVAASVTTSEYRAPLIAVSSDGNVTLRVEQQPLDWVLEQIAVQSGWSDVRERAGSVSRQIAAGPAAALAQRAEAASIAARTPASCPESSLQVDPMRVLQQIESGAEAEQFQGLMLAAFAGIKVAEPMLKHLFETGRSERVQVAAFEAYLALRADRSDALRTAIEEAQYAPTVSIQREAKQRLAELRELEHLDTLPPLADP